MKINNFSKITLNILGSRLTGFIRDVLLANFLGANLLSDAFLFAYRLPNLFRRIFAEGAVNSVFIPMYVNLEKENKKLSNDFIWFIFIIFFIFTGLLTVLVVLFNDNVISILAPGFVDNKSQFNLASILLPITFPFLIFVTLSAILSSVLNTKGSFFLPSFLSVILNIFMIVSLLIYKSDSYIPLAWSMIVAGLIQLTLLFINLSFLKIIWKLSLNSFSQILPKLVIFFKRFFYSVVGSGIVQLNIFISMIFASLVGKGSISHIYYADRIIDLPFALIAVAMSITLLPYLSKNILDENKNAEAFNQTIIFCYIFALPSSFAIFFLGSDIVQVLFGRGEFLESDVLITSKILIIYSLSLPAYMIARICSQVFFSYERVDLPVKASIPTFLSNFLMCFFFYKSLGVVGLAIAGAISIWLNVLFQIFFLRRFFYSFYEKIKIINIYKILKIIFSSFAMISVLIMIEYSTSLNIYLTLFFQILFGILVFFITLKILKLNEYKLIYKSKKFN